MTDYSNYIDRIGGTLEVVVLANSSATPFQDPQYNNYLPQAIADAELRIYRDLDLLLTRVVDTTGYLTPNDRYFKLPTSKGVYVVLEEVSLYVNGVRQPPLRPTSKEYIDTVWPDDLAPYVLVPRLTSTGAYRLTSTGAIRLCLVTETSVPTFWATVDQKTIRIAPPPDQPYQVNCFGTQRPTPLSATNPSTILTQYFPDLFFAATCVSWAGFQRDYGQASDDPTKAMSWGGEYDKLLASAAVEEMRKKLRSVDNTSKIPSPMTPGKG